MAVANEVSFREHLSANRRVIRKEAGNDIQDECQMLSIVVKKNASSSSSGTPYEEWLKFMREGEPRKQVDEPGKQASEVMIRKVPDMLREKESSDGCFDPLVVSIGPYHHGKSKLEEVERLKTPMALQFVKESGKLFDYIYLEVERISGDARKCYPEDSTYQFDQKEFAQMMFLDGCFILQFIYNISWQKMEGMKSNIAAFVRRDLLLLENQLPYQVLKVLMRSRFKGREGDELIGKFINSIRGGFHQESFIEKTKIYFTRCLRVLLKDKNENEAPKGHSELTKAGNEDQTGDSKTNKEENEHQPVHLLDLLRTRFVGRNARKADGLCRRLNWLFPTKGSAWYDWYSYPAAKELRTLGIHLRPSKGDCFTDIKFRQMVCTLFLPKLMIDDTTKSLLLNLVAYESCPGGPDDGGITSYICFMDSLIDQAEDVKELRSKRIIYNILGSDQQAAELFNGIAKDLVPSPYAFVDVKNQIERHCKNKFKTSMSEWLNSHFSSPWTFIAFLAATFALILSIIQTHISLLQYCQSINGPYFLCLF